MKTRVHEYRGDDKTSIGYLAVPDGDGTRPGILVVHEAPGRDDHVKRRAEMLAGLGYVALAADLYGGGVVGSSPDEAFALMGPLREDTDLLRRQSAPGSTRWPRSRASTAAGLALLAIASVAIRSWSSRAPARPSPA